MTFAHDKYVEDYDDQIKTYDCYITEVLFGLSYEYIRNGESILDVGIGTGIYSLLFHSAGLQVDGIDVSREMLKICEQKGIARELIEQNLLVFTWPYPDDRFDHVISCGVFHFIGDLDWLFHEISRVQKPNGIFAFTAMNPGNGQTELEKYESHKEDGQDIYAHNLNYVYQLLADNNYTEQKEIIRFVGQTPFRAIIA